MGNIALYQNLSLAGNILASERFKPTHNLVQVGTDDVYSIT